MFGREPNPFSLRDQVPNTQGKVRNFNELLAEIERIRSVGYSILDEDLEEGVVGVSAPVIDHTGRIIAALNVSGPKKRIGDKIEALGSLVRKGALTLSRNLGGS
ncbi:IclR family transcriptional regulator domain-containing protein [Leucobacter insecticola]|uniref:IclR family transcriptional regulator domain-containing protein n=1 Tax=Leucobacter insecticola TaxID=2714934 RepID=UPI001FCC9E10|nr:IclR family transcriptional regulator C-terminal domain-containing protein [Leucobacter insecticola]